MVDLAEYADLVLRPSLTAGKTRYGGAASPDVIPWGKALDPDPAKLAEHLDQDLGHPLVADVVNNVYVRTRNTSQLSERTGQIFVGIAPRTLLLWPDTLVPFDNANGKPYFQLKVPKDGIGVSMEPFRCVPAHAHDSVASWISTIQHPMTMPPDPELTSVPELAAWLAEHEGYAARSTGYGFPDDDDDDTYHFVGDYHQRAASVPMSIFIACTACKGFDVGLVPIKGGKEIVLEPTRISGDNMTFVIDVEPSAGFTSTLDLSIDRNDLEPSEKTEVTLIVSYHADDTYQALSGHKWFAHKPKRQR